MDFWGATVLRMSQTTSQKIELLRGGDDFEGLRLLESTPMSLTDSPSVALTYAVVRARDAGHPAGMVLAVRIPIDRLEVDRHAYEILNERRQELGLPTFRPPRRKDWERSLKEMGSVIYVPGTRLSPDDVRLVHVVWLPRDKTWEPSIRNDRRFVRSLHPNEPPDYARWIRRMRDDVVER